MKFTSIVTAAILGIGSIQAMPVATQTSHSITPVAARVTDVTKYGCTNWPWKRANGFPCHKNATTSTGPSSIVVKTQVTQIPDGGCTNWPWKRANGLPCNKNATTTVHHPAGMTKSRAIDATYHSQDGCPNWPWKANVTPCSSIATPAPTISFSKAKSAETLSKRKNVIGHEDCVPGQPKIDKLASERAVSGDISAWHSDRTEKRSETVNTQLKPFTDHCRHDPTCFDNMLPRQKRSEEVDDRLSDWRYGHAENVNPIIDPCKLDPSCIPTVSN